MTKWIRPNRQGTTTSKKFTNCGMKKAGDVQRAMCHLPFAGAMVLGWKDKVLRIRARGRQVNGQDLKNAKTKQVVWLQLIGIYDKWKVMRFSVGGVEYEYDIRTKVLERFD